MNRSFLYLLVGAGVLGAAALGGGCGNSTIEFGTGGAGHGGGAGGSGNATSSSSGASSSGSVTTSSSSSGGAGTSSSSGAATSSSSGGGGCTLDAQDDACVKCSKKACCSTLVPCQNDAACVCWTGCLTQHPNDPGACAGCGPYDNTTSAFVDCAAQSCSNECGAGSSSSSSSSSGGGLCAPMSGDSDCTSCAKMKCCSDVTACVGDTNCVCWVTCLSAGGGPTSCFGQCGAPDGTTNALSQCSLQQCPNICP